jgi:hypothetical protein
MAGLLHGIVLRELCWETLIDEPHCWGVARPLTIMNGSNAVYVRKPGFEGLQAGEQAITIVGGTYDTTATKIDGGYVQGFKQYGVVDSAIGTTVTGTYFERCMLGDIFFDGAIGGEARRTQHYGNVGTVAIKARRADGINVVHPVMSNAGRRIGLFDFDASCQNSYAQRVSTASAMNLPEGITTGIGAVALESAGVWTPTVAGSRSAGSAFYSVREGTWRRIGKQVHVQAQVIWSAHTGSGNVLIDGLPPSLTPASFSPQRVGQTVVSGMPWTGPLLFAALTGAAAQIGVQQVASAGAVSLLPMAASGSVAINMVYDL